jgi:hypothetical protein
MESTESKLFRYGLRKRPPSPGSVPAGFLRIDPPIGDNDTRYGIVVYDHPWPLETVKLYELQPILEDMNHDIATVRWTLNHRHRGSGIFQVGGIDRGYREYTLVHDHQDEKRALEAYDKLLAPLLPPDDLVEPLDGIYLCSDCTDAAVNPLTDEQINLIVPYSKKCDVSNHQSYTREIGPLALAVDPVTGEGYEEFDDCVCAACGYGLPGPRTRFTQVVA